AASFIVWQSAGTGGGGIRGARLGRDGQALDAAPIVVVGSSTSDALDNPRAIWNGTNYVVSWETTHYNSSFSLLSRSLTVTRVSPAGAALGGGFQIATHPTQVITGALASDGAGGVLVTYAFPDVVGGFPLPRVKARLYFETTPAGACSSAAECASGFCVDGVCCNSACGNGS